MRQVSSVFPSMVSGADSEVSYKASLSDNGPTFFNQFLPEAKNLLGKGVEGFKKMEIEKTMVSKGRELFSRLF